MTQLQSSHRSVPVSGLALMRLRAATHVAHEQLEARLAIAGPAPTDETVLAYFRAFYGWLAPVERQLWRGPWPRAMQVPERSQKGRWLASDLLERGVDAASLPACTAPFRLPDLAARCGFAYVVEGAGLGGRVLATRLDRLGSPFASSRFLHGHGAATAGMWRDFCAQLELHLDTSQRRAVAAAAAEQAFLHLRLWLASAGLLRP